MSNERRNRVFAEGRVSGVGGVIANPVTGTGNYVATRTGVGDYLLTWTGSSPAGDQIDALQCNVQVTVRGATAAIAQVGTQLDASVQILVFDAAGVAAEGTVDFVVTATGF
jgi:hypothetical protein